MIKNGALGELAAMKHFLSEGYEIYSAVTDSSTFDMLLVKDNTVLKVEVKTTSTRNRSDTGWEVQLKSVRSNRTTNRIVNFESTKTDLLVVYVTTLDKLYVFNSKDIMQKTAMVIND